MRARVLVAVTLVLALSCATMLAWGYAKCSVSEVIADVIEGINVAAEPRFEVARGTRTVKPEGERRLTVENPAGCVEVLPGGPDISVAFTVYARGEDKAEAARRADVIAVRTGRDAEAGNKIWVEVAEGKRWPSGVSVDLVVAAPRETALTVEVASADVQVHQIEGDITVRSASGDISVCGSCAPVHLSTASGDVQVADAGAEVEVRASSGDLLLSDITGPVAARTASGDIRIRAVGSDHIAAATASGDIDVRNFTGTELAATTSSGDIDVRDIAVGRVIATAASGDVEIRPGQPFSAMMEARSASGDVTVTLHSTSDCRVEATTVSGAISSRLDLGECSYQRRRMRGRLGAGRGLVEVSTTSGDIQLLPAN